MKLFFLFNRAKSGEEVLLYSALHFTVFYHVLISWTGRARHTALVTRPGSKNTCIAMLDNEGM